MTHQIDDDRLTAYALGELEGAEAAEVEAKLATNPDARREVEAIRAMAASLTAELGREPAAPLTGEQRAAIADAARQSVPTLANRPNPGPRRWYLRPWAAVAASLLLVIGVGAFGPESVRFLNRPAIGSGPGGGYADWAAAAADPAANPVPERAAEVERKAMAVGGGGAGNVVYLGLPAGAYVGSFPAQQKPDEILAVGAVRLLREGEVEASKDLAWFKRASEEAGSAESYSAFAENPFVRALGDDARSTFAMDVDTASYSNVRRLLRQGVRPDKGAIRIEEMINYFAYDYPAPEDGKPLAIAVEVGACPWAPGHRLALIGLKAKAMPKAERKRANLVFLIDVSGSMQPANKLPLVKRSLRMLVPQLRADDRVALVVYAGSSGLVLPSTEARDRAGIEEAVERLQSGGSTNGAQGIELAYEVAKENFVAGGINRVILCTDGDFNVGVTSESALVELIEAKAKTGVFLTALGFGMGNLKDSTLQKLADKGNGNYGYVDGEQEAKKLLVDQVDGTLVAVAKDARIQVEFNPEHVGAWRLIGYEKRVMANRDFHDDTKDAGEVGAGHTVTALYEIIPAGSAEFEKLPKAAPMEYQGTVHPGAGMTSANMMTVAFRYKPPDGDVSSLVETRVKAEDAGAAKELSRNFRWASAVAMFGMELRGSAYKGITTWPLVDELAREAKGDDPIGLRAELLELIKLADKLSSPVK